AAGAHRNPPGVCRHNRTEDPWRAPRPTEPYVPYVRPGRPPGAERHGSHGSTAPQTRSREPLTERGGEYARALSAPLGVPPPGPTPVTRTGSGVYPSYIHRFPAVGSTLVAVCSSADTQSG